MGDSHDGGHSRTAHRRDKEFGHKHNNNNAVARCKFHQTWFGWSANAFPDWTSHDHSTSVHVTGLRFEEMTVPEQSDLPPELLDAVPLPCPMRYQLTLVLQFP